MTRVLAVCYVQARFPFMCAALSLVIGLTSVSCTNTPPGSESSDDDDNGDDDDDDDDDDDTPADDDDDDDNDDGANDDDDDDDHATGDSSATDDPSSSDESQGSDGSTDDSDATMSTTTSTNTSTDPSDDTGPIVDVMPPSFLPPGGLMPNQVPQFIVFGFDDNRYTDGMKWVLDTFEGYKNPKGQGNPKTFDDQAVKITFYFTTDSLEMGEEGLEEQWRRVQTNRYEIGNHTHTHRAHEESMSWSWPDEMATSNDTLAAFFNLDKKEILGIRAPFLQHDAALFDAIEATQTFLYDCSVTHTPSGDGHDDWKFKRHIWPYTLENDFYFNTSFTSYGKRPGIWTLPVYTMPRGATKPDRFDTDVSGKFLAGFDSTAYGTVKMSATDFLNSMKWSLDLAMEEGSNRAPLTIGVHSDTYSAKHHDYDAVASLEERRKAITDFLDYAMTFPHVRVVSAKQLLQWMSNPTALE